MSYSGDIALTNISNRQAVTVTGGLGYFSFQPPMNCGTRLYADNTYHYMINNADIYRAPLNQPANYEKFNNLVIGTGTGGTVNSTIYAVIPFLIGDYFYGYGSTVWKAHKSKPMNWINTGVAVPALLGNAPFYSDGTNIYFYGGSDGGATVSNKILKTTFAAPTVVVDTGQVIPAAYSGVCLATIGSTIYLYGGLDSSFTQHTNIWSASTASPTIVTNTGNVLPDVSAQMASYVDGSFVWLYVAGASNNHIFRASISTPSVVTDFGASGNAVSQGGNMNPIFTNSTSIYLYSRVHSFYGYTEVWKASKSTPGTLVSVNRSPPVDFCLAGVAVHNGSIYVLGGHSAAGAPMNNIQVNDPANICEWRNSSSVLPGAVEGATCIKTSQYLYLIGGQTANGNVYRASLSTPETWTLDHSTGPNRNFGSAMIIDGVLWYLGGESAVGTAVSTIWRADITNDGQINSTTWVKTTGTGFNYSLPAVLSRFNLIVAGDYIYILNGYTTGGGLSTAIYRAPRRSFLSSTGNLFINVGTVTQSVVDASTVVANGMVYICHGGATSTFDATSHVTRATLLNLINGQATFNYEASALGYATGGARAVFLNDQLFFLGNRNVANGFGVKDSIKNYSSATFNLTSTNLAPSYPTPIIDPQTGALAQISLHQNLGMLPWHIAQ